MPRPPIQHHRLLLTLPDDWEDVADRIERIVAIQAAGKASAGFLGNPAVGIWLVGAIVAFMAGLAGKEGAEVIMDFFAKLEALHGKEGDKSTEADAFINAQRALIEFFAPILKPFLP